MLRFLRAATSVFALSLALPACAQQPATAPNAQAQGVTTQNTKDKGAQALGARAGNDADPALWVVKDKDTTVYLFGTIHVLKSGLTWFDEAVKAAFDRSDEVKLEIVMPDPAAMQGLVQATGVAAPGTPPLTQRLPAAKRAAFTKAVTDLGLPANALDTFKPWLAATQLSVAPLSKLGYDSSNGPEEIITAAAKQARKPLTGLETPEQQLGFFGSLSDAAQLQFLESTVEELPTLDRQMAAMVDEWARGDPDALAREMNDELKSSPEVAKVLLTDRNARWAAWIKQRMTKPGTVFIAVGAGHLAGPDSVQAQLAKLGVKARRVRY